MSALPKPTKALIAHASEALSEALRFSGPADQAVSRHFRHNRDLGQQDRAFVAETVFAALRRRRSLALAARSGRTCPTGCGKGWSPSMGKRKPWLSLAGCSGLHRWTCA